MEGAEKVRITSLHYQLFSRSFQIVRENSTLETSLKESRLANDRLVTDMKQVESEMKSVQQRLQNALSQLTNARDKGAKDEERITVLQSKCSQLEDR